MADEAKQVLMCDGQGYGWHCVLDTGHHGSHMDREGIYWTNSLSTPDSYASCGCCGSRMVSIRGRYPKDERRIVCPTCQADRLDEIRSISDRSYGVAVEAWQAGVPKVLTAKKVKEV